MHVYMYIKRYNDFALIITEVFKRKKKIKIAFGKEIEDSHIKMK